MQSNHIMSTLLLVIPLVLTIGCSTRTTDSQLLVVADSDLTLGPIWASNAVPWTIRVTNASTEDLELDELVPSCRCTHVANLPMKISAGATSELHLLLDLSSTR